MATLVGKHARHFSRKRGAEQWLASQEVVTARGEWVDPTPPPTVRQTVDWLLCCGRWFR
jgi:hypothetical protein